MRLTCRILRFINASEPLAVKYSNDAPTMPQNSIPTPKGFLISTTSARIKESARKDDLAWLTSEKLCTGAAVFTRNAFPAAPVQVSRTVLNTSNGLGIFGVILNSGNANAVTGNQGLLDAWNMAEMADSMYRKRFNIKLTSKKHKSLVLSTGVIGVPMPIGNIKAKLDELTDNLRGDGEGWMRLAKAMMTTDTKPKLITEELEIEGVKYVLCGVAKGSGMIHPNMATLLSIMASDISLTANATKTVLEKSVESSFNCITVDGDTSTNDTAILLSNGAADGPTFDVTSEYFPQIQSAFSKLSKNLAELIVKDGEGATKFLRIKCEVCFSTLLLYLTCIESPIKGRSEKGFYANSKITIV